MIRHVDILRIFSDKSVLADLQFALDEVGPHVQLFPDGFYQMCSL